MSKHIYVEQQNVPELVNTTYFENIKDVVDINLDNSSDLKGVLQALHVYNDTFTWFTNHFPRLSIVVTNGQYIRFEDNVIFNLLSNANIGDGVGITPDDAALVSSLPNTIIAAENSEITKFNELIYFNKITSIPISGFRNYTSLQTINLTNITNIGNMGFSGCKSLEVVNIPNCTSIGWQSFQGCSALRSITLNSNTPNILSASMFSGCTNLEEINGLDLADVTSIPNNVFALCNKLFIDKPFINNNITSIDYKAFFQNTSIEEVICSNVKTLAETNVYGGIFHECTNLNTVVFSEELTLIPAYCFYKCTSLESFDFSHITEIKNNAFQNSGIKNVVFSSNITNIGRDAFANCSKITNITFPNSVTVIPNYCCSNCLSLASVTFGNNVTTIGERSFQYCNLQYAELPSTVTYIGDWAFGSCKNNFRLVIHATTPPTVGGSKIFNGISYTIYVPDESVESYKTELTNYANNIYGLSELT